MSLVTLGFRALLVVVLAAHVLVMYGLARTMGGQFGFTIGTAVLAALFALAMLVPLVWAVTIPELPQIYTGVVRARRWWRHGRCPACGYPRSEAATCSECGAPAARPGGYRVTGATIRLYVAVNLLAWALGCVAAETVISIDEAEFRREVAGVDDDRVVRERRWPDGSFTWDREEGFSARGGLGR